MTGNLINKSKRKREEAADNPAAGCGSSMSAADQAAPSHSIVQNLSTASAAPAAVHQQQQQHGECYSPAAKRDRRRDNCDTPPSDSSGSDDDDADEEENLPKNSYLLEALQKIVELQNELADLESDLNLSEVQYPNNDNDDDDDDDDDDELDAEVSFINRGNLSNSSYEAEALGFAMCARETLLFLRNEGVAENSLLYKALKDRLIGKAHGIPI